MCNGSHLQGGAVSRLESGRLDHHIWVEIPQTHPMLQKCWTGEERDVWLFKTTLHLEDFDWGHDSNANWSPIQVSINNLQLGQNVCMISAGCKKSFSQQIALFLDIKVAEKI